MVVHDGLWLFQLSSPLLSVSIKTFYPTLTRIHVNTHCNVQYYLKVPTVH